MYEFIINPKTNRKVSIFGKTGKKILKNYIEFLRGGANLTPNGVEFYQQLYEKLYHVLREDPDVFLENLYYKIPTNILPSNFFINDIYEIQNYDDKINDIASNLKISYNYVENSLQVYDRAFFNLKNISNLEHIKIYAQMREINISDNPDNHEIMSIQDTIFKQMISPIDIATQITFFQSLNDTSKRMFFMQKKNPDYLKFFRNKLSIMSNDLDIDGEFDPDASINNKIDNIVNFNILANLYTYVPPLQEQCVVYRCEDIWSNTRTMINGYLNSNPQVNLYEFNGVTSTSTDPRMGYSFNKLFFSPKKKVIFKIFIPKNSKVLIPSVSKYYTDNNIDPEFEVLLFNNAIIKILKIDVNKNVTFFPSETLISDIDISQPINKRFDYYVTAEFLGYNQFNY